MELFSSATTFAQIVSLIADYAAQKSGRDMLSIADFAEWTATHGHAEVMRAIERNQAISIGVKAALADGREELLEKLRALDEKISAVAAGSGPFDDIARALRPTISLSQQARSLLRVMEEAKADSAIELSDLSGTGLLISGASGKDTNFSIEEPRFFEDDLVQLIALGLLSSRVSNIGRVFRPTRLGAKIGQELLAQKDRS